MIAHWKRIHQLTGWAVLAFIGCSGCGPGIRFSPSPMTDGVGVFFSSKTALNGEMDGTATESENIWLARTNDAALTPLTQNTNALLGSFSPSVSADGSIIAFHSLASLTGGFNGPAAGSFNIWVMRADGSNLTPITRNQNGSLHSRTPQFSPDCTKIVFSSNTALNGSWNGTQTDSSNIWIINADGTNPTPLTRNTISSLSSFTPVFSPDGSKIAFASMTDLDGAAEWNGTRTPINIWIMNADGTGLSALTRNTNTLASLDSQRPLFSPDGTKIIFSSMTALDGSWNGSSAGTENIWIMNIDGTGRTPLTQNQDVSAPSGNAEFSPDGQKIAFQSRTALSGAWNATPVGVANIWIMNADGTQRSALTKNQTAASTWPVFTSNGASLVFWSRGPLDQDFDTGTALSTDNLWVMSVDGSGKLPLTMNSSAIFNTSLSAPALFRSGTCGGTR